MKDSVLNKPELEYIVDIPTVVSEFKKSGLEMVSNEPFKEKYGKWQKIDSKNMLSTSEQNLSFLNVVLVFKKK
jgi:hypothetical protein